MGKGPHRERPAVAPGGTPWIPGEGAVSIPGVTPGACRVRPPGWTGQHPQAKPPARPGQPPRHPRTGGTSLSPRPCVCCRPGSWRSGHPSPLGWGRLACPDAQSISEDAPRALTIPSSGLRARGVLGFPDIIREAGSTGEEALASLLCFLPEPQPPFVTLEKSLTISPRFGLPFLPRIGLGIPNPLLRRVLPQGSLREGWRVAGGRGWEQTPRDEGSGKAVACRGGWRVLAECFPNFCSWIDSEPTTPRRAAVPPPRTRRHPRARPGEVALALLQLGILRAGGMFARPSPRVGDEREGGRMCVALILFLNYHQSRSSASSSFWSTATD